MPDEAAILRRVAKLARRSGNSRITLGIGDDCTIYSPRAGEDLVFTTDLLVEDIHFRRATHSAADAGHKALARGLSDIAAMGATPRFCLLSLALPKTTPGRWRDGFFRGLLALAAEFDVTLAGGDLGTAPVITADIVVAGSVPKGKALRRDGAKAGDQIFVSHQLGASALGLETTSGLAGKRHRRPVPQVALGSFGRTHGASACIDLSDGLSSDLHRLCVASGVAAAIGMPPVFPGATREQALHGGEDYELLFTVPPQRRFAHPALTCIGTIETGPPGRVRLDGKLLRPSGYDHFRTRTL